MPRRAYRDRTRGGIPTACNGEVDLDLTELRGGTIMYKGRRPTRTRRIGKGSYGVVSLYTYPDGAQLTVKKQPAEWDAIDNMPIAESLRSCELVDFKAIVDRTSAQIWTIMEHLTSDCRAIPESKRREYAPEFASFLLRTLDCLLASGASFCDMKLGNVAYKMCQGKPTFKLIDLDGLGPSGAVSTYPAVAKWAAECDSPQEQQLQTRYAFGIAAMMFEQPNSAYPPFYHDGLASIEDRLKILRRHAEATLTTDVYKMIEEHAITVLLRVSSGYPRRAMLAEDMQTLFGEGAERMQPAASLQRRRSPMSIDFAVPKFTVKMFAAGENDDLPNGGAVYKVNLDFVQSSGDINVGADSGGFSITTKAPAYNLMEKVPFDVDTHDLRAKFKNETLVLTVPALSHPKMQKV